MAIEIVDASFTTMQRAPFLRWLVPKLPFLVLAIVLAALITAFLWKYIFISIESGQEGVLYRLFSGTQLAPTYGTGLHLVAPWNTIYRYETRKQVVTDSFEVLSVRGLPVHLELAVRYQPEREQLGRLHQSIGPDYPNRVVTPQTESVLRRELSRYTAEQIYTNESGLLTKALLLARDEIGRNYVVAEDIVIRSISLPTPVKQAIEDKLTQREKLLSYTFRLQTAEQEAERKRDEARGIRDYQAAIDASLNDQLLRHAGIRTTRDLATSVNANVVLISGEKNGLPLIPGER